MSVFTKALSEIDESDIDQLISEGYPEGTRLELKSAIPTADGNPSSWNTGGNISANSRDRLLSEVVAFANAYGGVLLIGISEDPTNPHHAGGKSPVPRCEELAVRLRQQARDCIEPIVPLLETTGIPTTSDGSGIVAINVGRSFLAPHRLRSTLHSYIRRSDRCEIMTMREIQDLTLRSASGSEKLEAFFRQRRDRFADWVKGGLSPWIAVRVSYSPIWPISETSVYREPNLLPELSTRIAASQGGENVEIVLPVHAHEYRPIVRGSMRCSEFHPRRRVSYELHNTGEGELAVTLCGDSVQLDNRVVISSSWVMNALLNGLIAIKTFRQGVGHPDAEYALNWEIQSSHETVGLLSLGGRNRIVGKVDAPAVFPTLSVGDPSDFNAIASLAYEDLLHAAGLPSPEMLQVGFP